MNDPNQPGQPPSYPPHPQGQPPHGQPYSPGQPYPPGPHKSGSSMGLVIGLIALVTIIVIGVALYLSGVFGGGSGSKSLNSSYGSNALDTNLSMPGPSAVTPVAPAAAVLTPATLAGHWSVSQTGCASGIIYTADGRWGVKDNPLDATYSISGNMMTTTSNGITNVARIEAYTGNQFTTVNAKYGWRTLHTRCAGSGAATAAPSPPLAAAPAGGLPARLAQAAAQFQSRLPMRSGPTTISSVTASGSSLTMQVAIDRDISAAQWPQLDTALRSNICSGAFGALVRTGAQANVQMQDSAGEPHLLTISSC